MPVRRDRVLRELGGIERLITLTIDGEPIGAVPESDVERTTADGKTSSVHFLRFPFTDAQVEGFRRDDARVVLAITHQKYDHMAALPAPIRAGPGR